MVGEGLEPPSLDHEPNELPITPPLFQRVGFEPTKDKLTDL